MNDLNLYSEVVQGHVNHCGLNSSKTTWPKGFKFTSGFVWGIPSRHTYNFPWKWAWPNAIFRSMSCAKSLHNFSAWKSCAAYAENAQRMRDSDLSAIAAGLLVWIFGI